MKSHNTNADKLAGKSDSILLVALYIGTISAFGGQNHGYIKNENVLLFGCHLGNLSLEIIY